MNKSKLFIRETIIKLLEEDTKFSEGDSVTTSDNDEGIVTLSKHPFYAVQLNDTGTTHSYHFTDLTPNIEADNTFYGKYDVEPKDEEPEKGLQESAPSEIIHLDGLLIVQEDLNVGDVLSDIRSIIGITVVRPIDVPGETHKSKLKIKIDPFPFKGIGQETILGKIKSLIRKVPGVKEFWSIKIPIQETKFRIKEIKVNNPTIPLPLEEFSQAMRDKANTLINGWDKIILLTQKYGYDLKDDTIPRFYKRLTPSQKIKFIGELDKL